MHFCVILFCLLTSLNLNIFADKLNLETLNNYSEFLNFGEKKSNKVKKGNLENDILKSKIDILGEIFKKNIDSLKNLGKLDLVFLIDASSSVGESNFRSELKFVKKLMSDVTVDFNNTRVAVVTFSSSDKVDKTVDEISIPRLENNKCLLLNKQLTNLSYTGGGTYTLGAFETAKNIFENSRNDSKKVLFLITDGFSNGGDPVPLSTELKQNQITIFTIGIQNGNYKELYELSSTPGEFYSYLLDSFQEFESLARRALHVDLKSGDYIPLGINSPCDSLCEEGNCCDSKALCSCGTSTGHYSCVCHPGYYGTGLRNACLLCPLGTYSDGPNLCLPCPDIHHTTHPPANSINDCKCKTGYQPTKDYACEIVKCPKITKPDHGYFVKKRDCVNVLNSACGVRCEVGYALVGSSIRLCQSNGTWSGDEPSCQVRTCDHLSPPPYGEMKCAHTDLDITYNDTETNLPVDTVCSFKCSKGRTLIGSSQRTCLPLARWDGLKTSCKQIKCNKLPLIQYGRIEPKSCTIGKQVYGKNCTIICNDGFDLIGSSNKSCTGNHGTWMSKTEDTICKDITPPQIECPTNITTKTEPGKKYGYASWKIPEVKDNSQLEVSVWMNPIIDNISEYKFEIGETKVTYFAQDKFHNKAKCEFSVKVLDEELPTIETCISPPIFLTTNKNGANITWEEPNIFDNSQRVKVTKSHEFGFFEIGTTVVTYTAIDNSSNKNVCTLNITIEEAHCEALPDPIYGSSECASQSNGMQCVITCQEGYAVPLTQPNIPTLLENSTTNFLCNNSEPVWFNPEGLLFPECSVTEVPKISEQNGTVNLNISDDICNNTIKLSEIENDIKLVLKDDACEGTNCTVTTESLCDSESKEEEREELTNKIKRDLTAFEQVPHRNRTRHGKRRKANIKFQVRGKYIDTSVLAEHINLKLGTNNSSITYQKVAFICPDGFIPRKNRCVQCPKGTFHNTTKNRCQSCRFGFYNDKLGQIKCTPCPENHSTRKLHSKSISECREQCPPGTYAKKKLIKQSRRHPNITIERVTLRPYCRSCDIGEYQPDYGQTQCIPCPKGHITTSFGATNFMQCEPTSSEICRILKKICNDGECMIDNDYSFTCKCNEGFYGSYCEKKMTSCDSNPCLNGGICKNLENDTFLCVCPKGYLGKYCQEIQEMCPIFCLNNGRCIQNDDDSHICLCPKGYGGERCEIQLRYCDNYVCDNNGICVEEQDGFKCKCRNGYLGKRCNILPCDYRPCRGNFLCVNIMEPNATKNSYTCTCPEGYTGNLCNELIDHCKENPCFNGGICISHEKDYKCDCPKLFYGNRCQHKRSSRYILNFPQRVTSDYVKLNGFKNNLTEITACIWIQTRDNFNYGTLISYATKTYDNAFTITDYTGVVLYINNKYIVTDVLLNDGLWHHICVLWKKSKGEYKVYVDGSVAKYGFDFSKDLEIQGGGNLILGQEQDTLGGQFSQSESFMGKIAYFDIWSKFLTEDEILQHYNDCEDVQFGNIYAWPEIQEYIYGNVKIENSNFCSKCEEPKRLHNGVVNIVNNVAYYSCNIGFQINNNSFSTTGRKCTKASKWFGSDEPYCKKIFCGYPGYVRNSFFFGKSYYYQDKVTYSCYEGYTLKGSITLKCTEHGTWYPQKPYCSGTQCVAFKLPERSNITIMAEHSYEEFVVNQSTFDIGTQVEIFCNESFTLLGESVLTCLENGTWDFEVPVCQAKLEATSSTYFSSTSTSSTTTTTTITTTELITLATTSMTTTTKRPHKIGCTLEQLPSPPINGYFDEDSLDHVGNGSSNVVYYKCRMGYKIRGENSTTCIIDGYWTEPNITCDPILCRQPLIMNNMKIKNEFKRPFHEFGNMIKFECEEGYVMIGNNVIRCLVNRRWTILQGKCIKKNCGKPSFKHGIIVEGSSYLFGDSVTVACPENKKHVITCNKEGQWDQMPDIMENC